MLSTTAMSLLALLGAVASARGDQNQQPLFGSGEHEAFESHQDLLQPPPHEALSSSSLTLEPPVEMPASISMPDNHDTSPVSDNPSSESETVQPKPTIPSRDANLGLITDPRYPCVSRRNGPTADVDIPVNTCASASFAIEDNVFLRSPGTCVGGSKTPYIAIYESADCTGEVKHPDWYDRVGGGFGPGHCLSKHFFGSKTKEDQWSIMFHCDNGEAAITNPDIMNLTLPQPPPVVEKPPPPRPSYASVSDSAVFIDELGDVKGFPRFLYQRPEADVCVNVAPWHKLKIYRNALCLDGSEALFAKWQGKGCRGEPESTVEVDVSVMGTKDPYNGIEMGKEKASSYAFWCTGDISHGKVSNNLFEDDSPNNIRIHYSSGPKYHQTVESDAANKQIGKLVWGIAIFSTFVLYLV